MIDASAGFIKDGNKNRLRDQDELTGEWGHIAGARWTPLSHLEALAADVEVEPAQEDQGEAAAADDPLAVLLQLLGDQVIDVFLSQVSLVLHL